MIPTPTLPSLLVGFSTTNSTRASEPTLSWNQLRCAGLNRHEAEEEEASRERTSDPLGPEFCVGHREVHDEA
jgi:hypothetical protein